MPGHVVIDPKKNIGTCCFLHRWFVCSLWRIFFWSPFEKVTSGNMFYWHLCCNLSVFVHLRFALQCSTVDLQTSIDKSDTRTERNVTHSSFVLYLLRLLDHLEWNTYTRRHQKHACPQLSYIVTFFHWDTIFCEHLFLFVHVQNNTFLFQHHFAFGFWHVFLSGVDWCLASQGW